MAARVAGGPALAVAYSGGRDSTALLHAALMAAESSGITIHALHVHHGLSDHADAWLSHCEAQCQGWARRGLPVMFAAERLQLKPTRGESIEAVARTARYAALRRMALACNASVVLLAHHRRDQAETLLLQALRGGGAAGLAAMPASIEREGLVWARPWLMQPSRAIAAYVARHRLKHIEDDSNADPRFGRNRLRLQVWPALEAAFPQAEASLADAATRAQQAVACASDLAAIDLEACTGLQGLDLVVWRRLAPHRAVNALRAWLRAECGAAASAAVTDRLMADLQLDGLARWPFGSGELRRYRGRLTWHDGAEAEPLASLALQSAVAIRRAGHYPLAGWGGVLVVERVKQGGVALRRLGAADLIARRGGELYQAAPGRTARSLKKQYQAAGVPAWARSGPLLFDADQLLFVPGLGIDARAWAAAGEPQVSIVWERHAAG